jgi:hypothetical protein
MERLRFGKTTQHDIDSEYKGSILVSGPKELFS